MTPTGESGPAVTSDHQTAGFRDWLARAATAVERAASSRRGLTLLFLGVAVLLSLAGWMRPPLSPDITGPHLSLGWWSGPGGDEASPNRRWVPDSLGVILLVVIAVAAVLVLWRPQYSPHAVGFILAGAIAGNAAAALNHPLLIQALDDEYEQRQQMSHVLGSVAEDVMTNPTNGRLGLLGLPTGDEQRGDLERGFLYLLHGRWLVLWSVVGLLLSSSGTLGPRLRSTGLWLLAGVVLSALVCSQRLQAEYYWAAAKRLEGECRLDQARASLQQAVRCCPSFEGLERTWLLAGKLDQLAGRQTPQARFFQAFQINRDKLRLRNVAYHEDLPWVLPGTRDYRMGLAAAPSQFNEVIAIGDGKSGTPSFRKGLPAASVNDAARPGQAQDQSFAIEQAYRFARTNQPRLAIAQLEELAGDLADQGPSVARRHLARLWTQQGLSRFLKAEGDEVTQEQRYYWRDRSLTSAQAAWTFAAEQDPRRRDSALYRGLVQARVVPSQPEQASELLSTASGGLADQVLCAEILNVLGDAYFEAGAVGLARRCYARSFDMFCLPKVINTRAQERLGGK